MNPIPRSTIYPALCTLLLALASTPARTQTPNPPPSPTGAPPTPVQVDNAESTSKPDDVQTPEANPARPTITNPAHIPPVGYLQFEQGVLQINGSPESLTRQLSVNEVIRLSLHPRLMVQFVTQPFAASRVADPPGAPAIPQRDPGDLDLGLQGVLIKEVGRIPSIALGYLRRVRNGNAPDLDIGSFSQSAVLLLSGDLGDFHYDTNFIVSEQTSDPIRRAQFGQTLSVTHDVFPKALDDKLEITGEIFRFTQPLIDATRNGTPNPRSNAVGTLWTVGYSLLPNLVLDAGFDHGLTSTSTNWQTFAGVTYLLPHRLWPHHDEPTQPGPHKHIHRR